MLLTKVWKTRSTDQCHESGRLTHARTKENVTTVKELVDLLKHECQKQTHRPTNQISKETDLMQCSIVQIIQRVLV